MHISDTHPDRSAALGRDTQDAIGKQLRAMQDDLAGTTLPERFTELLKRLDRRDDDGPH